VPNHTELRWLKTGVVSVRKRAHKMRQVGFRKLLGSKSPRTPDSKVLGVDRVTVIEEIDFDDEADSVVVHVRPRRSTKRSCGRCGVRAPGYDQGDGRRNWRALDVGVVMCRLRSDSRGIEAVAALDAWCAWTRRYRIASFVHFYRRILSHRDSIVATLTNDVLSDALVESTDTKLRLLTRMAYGFRSTDNLIALCLLDRRGFCPPVPGRPEAT
jgi:transposase